jgi:outer membrane protein insertion porin family
MLKRLIPILITVVVSIPHIGWTQEMVNVIVLPIEIHSQQDLPNLKEEVTGAIKKQLKEDGATIISPYIDPGIVIDTEEGVDKIREIGMQSAADWIIWGSMTWIGDRFSLDAKMVEPYMRGPVIVYTVEGKGVRSIPATVRQLTRDMAVKIFKREKVIEVQVKGNERIEDDAIKKAIKTKAGDNFVMNNIAKDLKAVYALGYFDDVRVESEKRADGRIVVFRVKEKPIIRAISVTGNKEVFDDDEIMETLDIRTGSVLNLIKVKRNVDRIQELYNEKNYHNASVSYKIYEREQRKVDLEFVVVEGEKIQINKITFQGNKSFSDDDLKDQMMTKEKGFFSFITNSGELNKEDLSRDSARIANYYHNNGFIRARVGEPQIEYKENYIEVTIKVDEGPRFKVGKVDIAGDLVQPKNDLMTRIKIGEEEYFNSGVVRNDLLVLKDVYLDEGYAYAVVAPNIKQNEEKLIADITYEIKKKQQVYFEEIIISGNTKTRDKVIRRQLLVYEQELYSGTRLKTGIRRLQSLNYFEDIKVDTLAGSSDDKMILKLDVTEKPTGEFSFGGGFSTMEDFFGVASIKQNNLFGRGQVLALDIHIGGVSQQFGIRFEEPWLFEIPLHSYVRVYKWQFEYDYYLKDSVGGGFGFSYPVFAYTRASVDYDFDMSAVEDVEEEFAPEDIIDVEGETLTTSRVMTGLNYDSRNHRIIPTKGAEHFISLQYAGLGGDIGYAKYIGQVSWYFPIIKKWGIVGFSRAKAGFVHDTGLFLPDWELFHLGGINSIRGVERIDMDPREDGDEDRPIGGDKFVQFNFELIFPILNDLGLSGVVFCDMGYVYDTDQSIGFDPLVKTVGGGLRWFSPMGPLRIEYGKVVDDGGTFVSGGQWEFAMGRSF